ncbi:MAG: hypothetical protein AAGA77_11310 [Bacteroidota bacterium]
MRIIYLFVCTLILGCISEPKEIIKYRNIDCEDNGFVNVVEWRKEVFHIDSIAINGETPLIGDLSSFEKVLGEIKYQYSINDEDVAIYLNKGDEVVRNIFDGAVVDASKSNAIINTIDFRNTSLSMVHPEITLKNGTPVSEVCKIFPRSCRLIPSNGNLWSGFIELKLHQSGLDFRRIFLIFKSEKLVKVKIVNIT